MGRTIVTRLRSLRHRFASESGIALMEIMMSTLVLGVVSVGVVTGMDVAQSVSGNQKSKATAANIAESELEKLRGLTIEELQTVQAAGPTTKVAGSVTYTITPTTAWVADQRGTTYACDVQGGNTYMRITVTVAWGTKSSQRVAINTIVSPGTRGVTRTYGALAIRMTDSTNGVGIPGVSVTLSSSGQSNRSGVTDSNGCVVWNSIPAATWQMQASRTNYIDADGNETLTKEVSVVGADVTYNEYQMFPGGRISGQFHSMVGATRYNSAPEAYVVTNGSVTRELTIPAGQTTFQTPPLRGDVGSYKIFAGACTEAELGATVPGTYSATATVGQTNVDVRLPSWDVVTQGNGSTDSMRVRVDSCQKTYYRSTRSQSTRKGRLDDPGFPYRSGSTTVCTDTQSSFLIIFPVDVKLNGTANHAADTTQTMNVRWSVLFFGSPISPSSGGNC